MNTLVSVSIQVDSYWPSTRDLLGRDAAINELSQRKAGKYIRAGTGMGNMDFAFEVEDVLTAKTKMTLILDKHLPGRKYTIQSTTHNVSKVIAEGVSQGIAKHLGNRKDNVKQDFGLGM